MRSDWQLLCLVVLVVYVGALNLVIKGAAIGFRISWVRFSVSVFTGRARWSALSASGAALVRVIAFFAAPYAMVPRTLLCSKEW